MQYILAFLEGIITFISPCLLPMLPVYVSYFAGSNNKTTRKTLNNAIGFVCGFTTVFIALGALAGTIGSFLTKYQTAVNIVTGLIVIIFGLNFMGVLKLNIFSGISKGKKDGELGFFSSYIFGLTFSISWTPCVGVFLGSALLLASQQGTVVSGIIMLVLYSLGLGIPFILSAVLIEKLKSTFNFIKKNYRIINIICGCLLVVVGILMMSGLLTKLVFTFV